MKSVWSDSVHTSNNISLCVMSTMAKVGHRVYSDIRIDSGTKNFRALCTITEVHYHEYQFTCDSSGCVAKMYFSKVS